MTVVQPIKVAILAMGGEGGGVLADWIVDLGEHNGHLAQTTSVPGVAQRTGATIYYVELYPQRQAELDGAAPVLALMPLPGDVDVVLASELMECGRAVQRGLVTPERTTLIASTHRVYSIAEKSAMGDGRVDSGALLAHAEAAAKRFVRFDMAAAAEEAGSVISAVLFGALAGTGVLPFSRAQFEDTIARGGVGVKPSLKAFDVAHARAAGSAPTDGALAASVVAEPAASALDGTTDAPAGATTAKAEAAGPGITQATRAGASPAVPAPDSPTPRATTQVDSAPTGSIDPRVRALLDRIDAGFAPAARTLAREGVRRLIDYQDLAYASLYLDRVARIAQVAARDGQGSASGGTDASATLVAETARHLALWMSYEDTIRVAALKTRASRFERVRGEVRAASDQVLAIDEYLHPRVQEIAETLPGPIGRRLERPGWLRRTVEHFTTQGRVVTTSSIGGFLMLYTVAGMKRWRRTTTRYAVENAAIEAWLARIAATAARDPVLATEIAQCQRLVKGYSDTHERGVRNYETVMAALDRGGAGVAPATLRELRDAALADEHGHLLRATLARHALA